MNTEDSYFKLKRELEGYENGVERDRRELLFQEERRYDQLNKIDDHLKMNEQIEKINMLNEKNRMYEGQIDQLVRNEKQNEQIIREQQQELQKQQMIIEQFKFKEEKYQKDWMSSEEQGQELARIKGQFNQMCNNNNQILHQKELLEQTLDEKNEKIKLLNKQVDSLREQIHARNEMEQNMMISNNEYLKKINNWKDKNSQKEMELEKMRYQMNEQKNYKEKTISLKTENSSLKGQLQSQQEEIAQKTNTIIQLNKTIQKQKVQLDHNTNNKQSQIDQFKDQRLNKLQKQLDEQLQLSVSNNKKIEQIQQMNQELNEKNKGLQAIVQRYQKEFQCMRQTSKSSENQNNRLYQMYSSQANETGMDQNYTMNNTVNEVNLINKYKNRHL